MASPLVPCLRYRDARAAIDWLVNVLGFAVQVQFPGEDNRIEHAQLTLGEGMIMVSSISDTPFGRFMRQPDEIDGRETQAPYVMVPDADAVYAQAKASGSRILIEIKDESYGGRGFSCADPEGHIWSVGTYDPWAPPSVES
tara:strand:- start:175 stop:597 length:423 start_codon:yes stop_codon:yes gene_type:complete